MTDAKIGKGIAEEKSKLMLGERTYCADVFQQYLLGVQSAVKCIDLAGEWIGNYPGHYDEVIRIEQNGDEVEAVKITGDEYVPAGEITWRANLQTLEGEGQIAAQEFQHPRFVPGRLTIVNDERIVFHWENCGDVEFRRDD